MKQLCYKKEIPILFSTEMVHAILARRKTHTRRTTGLTEYNQSPDDFQIVPRDAPSGFQSFKRSNTLNFKQFWDDVKCPYGKPGDLLYVKETFRVVDFYQESKCLDVMYEDETRATCQLTDAEWRKFTKWKRHRGVKPSLFMFKSTARIWLEVKEVRVERLQDIQYDDAMREGIDTVGFTICDNVDDHAKRKFQILWQSINGEESWRSNPWVWVISFKVLSTTGKPKELNEEW